jgi:hypothetical protein
MTNTSLRLAETLTSNGIRSVYGDPVELDGITLIPVALVQYGFGAGSMGGDQDTGAGGGGGGGYSIPLGAYVRDRNGLHFRPNIITLLVVGIPFVFVAGHAWTRIIRALKR